MEKTIKSNEIHNRILLDYILIMLENNSVPELHSHVCCCPLELVLDGNILLYNDVLSLRINEYLDYEGWTNRTNGYS